MNRLKNIGLFEIIVIQAIFYTILWLWDDYVGSLITFIFVPLFTAILLIALISEWIEKSKVPKKYFLFMVSAVVIPLLIAALMKYLFGSIVWE